MPKKEPNFEENLEKLEGIVEALEEGGLSLDDSLKQFEEGIKLSRHCEKALSEAEKKIEILTKNAEGELEAQPFDENAEAPAPAAKPKARAKRKPSDAPPVDDIPPDEEEEDGELLF